MVGGHVFSFIDVADIKRTLTNLGDEISDREAQKMVNRVDKDGAGRINYKEFVMMMQEKFSLHAASSFTSKQLKELRVIFQLFDKNKDGSITLGELRTVISALGLFIPHRVLEKSFKEVDLDGNGEINFNEFVHLVETRVEKKPEDVEMQELFRAFDKDNSGYIDAAELKQTLGEVGLEVTDREVAGMLREAGVTRAGRIHYDDFVRMMQGHIGKVQKQLSILEIEDDEEIEKLNSKLSLTISRTDECKTVGINVICLHSLLSMLNIQDDSKVAEQMKQQCLVDDDGLIDFKDLLAVAHYDKDFNVKDAHADIKKRKIFSLMDRDNKGYVTSADVENAFKSVGVCLQKKDIRELLTKIDVSSDGAITLENLQRAFLNYTVELDKDKVRSDSTNRSFMSDTCSSLQSNSPKLQTSLKSTSWKTAGKKSEEFKNCTSSSKSRCQELNEDEMKVMFAAFDKDRSGYVDILELQSTFKEYGMLVSPDEVHDLLKDVGVAGTRIYFDDFVKIIKKKNERKQNLGITPLAGDKTTQALFAAFKYFDEDNDDCITSQEIWSVLKKLGININAPDIRMMVRKADLTGNGYVNFPKFCELMKEHTSLLQPSTDIFVQQTTSEELSANGLDNSRVNDSQPQYEDEDDKIVAAFKLLDVLEVGQLNLTDIVHQCGDLAISVSDEKLQCFMQHSNNGTISLTEFGKVMKRYPDLLNNIVQQRNRSQSLFEGLYGKKLSILELQMAFDEIDRDKDGFIDANEVDYILSNLAIPFDACKLMLMMEKRGGNGTVDFNEFLRMMSRSRSGRAASEEDRKISEEEEMRQAFKVFDIDGNGVIDAQELRLTMQNLGENLSDEDVKAMIRAADKNGDGKIDYEEFIKMMYNK